MLTNQYFVPRGLTKNQTIIRVYIPILLLLISLLLLPFQSAQAADVPTFDVIDVIKDASVTIHTYDFPAGKTFTVYMGLIDTKGVDGIEAGTSDSGSGGSYEATFSIPDELKGEEAISIRLESPEGYYSYNWFLNEDDFSSTTTPPPAEPSGENGTIPTFVIIDVQVDENVTIQTQNFPANQTFVVTMGDIASKGVGGIEITETSSGSGGEFTETYTIPDELKGEELISIRLESEQGYYSYNWFINQEQSTEPETGTPEAPVDTGTAYTGIPTFSITNVEMDQNVSILTNNFPANTDFVVTMGEYGTQGVGGIVIGTTPSGEGGTFEENYLIPAQLKGIDKIAIRMESADGYYAYNWFFNR